MPSMPFVSKYGARLALAALAFLLAAPPAGAQVPVVPLEPARLLPPPDETGETTPSVALLPDGGYVAVWADIETRRVVGRRFGPADASGEAGSESFELTGEQATAPIPGVGMARGGEDAFLAVWEGPGWEDLFARPFDGSGAPLGPVETVALGETSPLGFDLAPRPGGGYVLAWGQLGTEGWEVWYRFLGPLGEPFGPTRVGLLPEDTRGPWVRVATDAAGGFAVTWSWWRTTDAVGAVEARGFASSGEPLGEVFDLVPEDETRFETQHDVASVGPDEYLLAWAAGSSVDVPSQSIRVLRFGEVGPDLAAARGLVTRGTAERHVGLPVLAYGPDGRGVVAWAEGDGFFLDRPMARLLDGDGQPTSERFELLAGPIPGDFLNGITADRGPAGLLVFAWGIGYDPAILPTGIEAYLTSQARRFQETAEPPPPPPDAPPLTSGALPGYRVWVEITDPAGDAVLGSAVEPCIPETLCIAGRLPDRHEVFVRVVGPKPNGRLWPTLVKFSTSQVEVWIEQVATGEVEYYLLEGARPGFDLLPGLFDREGFEP